MLGFLLKTVVTALAFLYLLPAIPGIEFHGGFGEAAIMAIGFSFLLWVVEAIAMALATVWTLSTLGLALLILIPLWIFGFWVMPALALELLSFLAPNQFYIHGFYPAVLGGFVMLAIGMFTGGFKTMKRCYKKSRGFDD